MAQLLWVNYSIQTRDWIFEKGYRFLSFDKNMSKNTAEALNLSSNAIGDSDDKTNFRH